MAQHRRKPRTVESDVYRALRLVNDVRAVASGHAGRRVARRMYGKATGRLARRIFG